MGNKPFQCDMSTVALAHYHFCAYKENRWAPIPLTKEWLIKFRFGLRMDMPLFVKVREQTSEHIFFENDRYKYRLAGNRFVVVKHVHDLQNLYHALTGEELTITK